jgi:hypothetical protein
MAEALGQFYPVPLEGQARDQFGRDQNRIGIITIPLDNSRNQDELTIGGSILWAIDASSISAKLIVSFQDYTSAAVPYSQGLMIRGVRYSQLYLSNEAQPGESITFLYAVETAGGLQIENPLQDAGEVNINNPGAFTELSTLNDATVGNPPTAVVPSTADAREVILQASSDNENTIRIGDQNVGINRGAELQPGQSLVLTTKSEVQAFSATDGQKLQIVINSI